jgi:hypothetical protein
MIVFFWGFINIRAEEVKFLFNAVFYFDFFFYFLFTISNWSIYGRIFMGENAFLTYEVSVFFQC